MGRAGWTWYTGSAAWMYRVWIEEVLGFKPRGDRLLMEPVIPDDWDGFEIVYRYKSATYEIAVRRRLGNERVTELDDRKLDSAAIPLVDDGGVHRVTIWLPQERSAPTRPAPSRQTQVQFDTTVVSVPESSAER
jgi:cellobiose phosphorylase